MGIIIGINFDFIKVMKFSSRNLFHKNITNQKLKKKTKGTLPAKFKFPMLNEVGVAW